jgi:ABC-type cobalamin/Fe3+-siderophores transport system ATPase subunit
MAGGTNVTAVLEARALSVSRGSRNVVHDVSVALAPGEGLALVGPNAAGKSTLVRALAGLLPAQTGGVWLGGRGLAEWSRDAVARAVALVATEDEGSGLLTVEDRVALGRYPHRGPLRPLGARDHEAVARALRSTGIESLARRRLQTLSAGERQLATLARGLAQEPQVLLLDEPAAHLDVGHQLQLFRVLDEVRGEGVAVLAVVHDLQRAVAWAPRIVLLADGRIAGDGTAEAVLGSPQASRAFGVGIRAHAVAGLAHPLYSFEEAR